VPGKIEIAIYDEFGADWKKLTPKARAEGKALLAQLQDDPYEPNLQRRCIIHDDEVFEYALGGGYSLFWKVHHPSLSITELNMQVLLVAIDPTSKPKK
jgi:mRNA-degrading endonuclease RelE of RelBE toxin-antitoxin system